METSAKNATNVERAFMMMAQQIKNRYVSVDVNACMRVYLFLSIYIWSLFTSWLVYFVATIGWRAHPSRRRRQRAPFRFVVKVLRLRVVEAVVKIHACLCEC